jgi:O-antigen biosynthesis protein
MSVYEKVSIIILVHNNLSMTRVCLQSLAKATSQIDHEVILLDNASDENAASLKDCGRLFQKLNIIRSEENLSFSKGNNLCAANALGDYFLFINNDVFLNPESIECMLACLCEDSSAGIIGGMLMFPGRNSVQHAGMQQMLWGFASNYGVGAKAEDVRIAARGMPFAVTGAMQCIRRNVFFEVGGFEERYSWGYEDVDLCLKIKSIGRSVIYEPGASGVHVESATLNLGQKRNTSANYRIYRETWDPILIPREREYLRNIKGQGIKRVVVFGTGLAALGLSKILHDNDIQVVAFTSSEIKGPSKTYLGKPVISLDSLHKVCFDRLMVATQFFFAVEPFIRDIDPIKDPIFPVLI